MIVKWIVCHVPDEWRADFSKAQEDWKALRHVEGFFGQIGGWDIHTKSDACILGLWENWKSYHYFMNHIHDDIFSSNNQGQFYESISVALCETLFKTPGSTNELLTSLQEGKIVRVDEGIVYKDSEQYFAKLQKMKEAGGMLSGAFCEIVGPNPMYLITTIWKDSSQPLSFLRSNGEFVKERLIVLEDSWKVLREDYYKQVP